MDHASESGLWLLLLLHRGDSCRTLSLSPYGTLTMAQPLDKPAESTLPAANTTAELLLTRTQAARRIGASVATVRRMEQSGELVPLVVDGRHLFRAPEVERYVHADEGELAAAVFQALKDGKPAYQIVIDLKLPPDRVERFVEAWVRMTRSWLVMGPEGSLAVWERTYKLGPLTPERIRRALEIAAQTPSFREKLMREP